VKKLLSLLLVAAVVLVGAIGCGSTTTRSTTTDKDKGTTVDKDKATVDKKPGS
jgi:hypothetical protein